VITHWISSSAIRVVEIHVWSDLRGEDVWFDPIGVLIELGQTVLPGTRNRTSARIVCSHDFGSRIRPAIR
jgi:hypothetical protein